MQKIISAAAILLLTALQPSVAVAQSGTITGDYIGCIDKSSLDEFMRAAVNRDERHMNSLIGSVCVFLKGQDYSIVSRGFGTSTIRVYAGGSSVVLWTVSEALR